MSGSHTLLDVSIYYQSQRNWSKCYPLWKCYPLYPRNLTGSKISTSSTKFVFFEPIGKKQNGHPGLWLAETFSTSPLNRIQGNLTGSKIWTSYTKFVFFGQIGKNKMAALTSDWLRHFWLLWIRLTEFNETWQVARSQRLLLSLCFSGRSEKQDGHPGLWLAETFLTSLKPLNGIQRNLTGSKISTSSTKFMFFVSISTQKLPPWPIHKKGCTLNSGAHYVALLASCSSGFWFTIW